MDVCVVVLFRSASRCEALWLRTTLGAPMSEVASAQRAAI